MIGNINSVWQGLVLIISFYESARDFLNQGEVVVVIILFLSVAFGNL